MPTLNKSLTDCTILIIEDARVDQGITEQHLRNSGFTQLFFAANGKIGLEMTEQLHPDLVILDLLMPEMDGFTYCDQIRRNPAFENMPIIVQTSLENAEDKLRAFTAGASDYISKPINGLELIARLRVHLTNRLLREQLMEQQKNIHAELHAACIMQERLMPSSAAIAHTEERYNLQIAQHFETSSLLGGDCWGMRALNAHQLAVYMFDFSGHGMTAAMNVFRMHTLMQDLFQHGTDAGRFLTLLNQHIHPLLERSEFATMFYGVINIEASSLQYATAAVPPTLLFRPHAKCSEWLERTGFPLGAIADAAYDTITTPFTEGDALLLFSDCLIETPNTQGEILSEDVIINCIQVASTSPLPHRAEHYMEKLLAKFRQHSAAPIRDDLTINIYCRNSTNKG